VAREVTEKRTFSLRAPKLSKDEIGMLAESFNTMLAEIERATRDLEASNEVLGREIAEHNRAEQEILRLNTELEKRVKERTAQLEYTNGEARGVLLLRVPRPACAAAVQSTASARRCWRTSRRTCRRRHNAIYRESGPPRSAWGADRGPAQPLPRIARRLERRDADVSELARQVVSDLQNRDPQRKVDISIWDGMRGNADSRLLRAALENLIGMHGSSHRRRTSHA